MPGGRPSTYTAEIGEKICLRLADGESLRSICSDDDMPAQVTVYKWVLNNDEFAKNYARARDMQAEVWADEIVDISDDGSNDYMEVTENGREKTVVNHENIQRSRLRVDTRKWALSKVLPKKYGDKLQVGGENGGPIRFEVTKIGTKE